MLQAVVVHWGCSREVYLTLLYLLPISQLYFLYLCFLVFLIFSLETEVAGSGGALGCSGEVYLTWTHFKVESDELSRHHHHHHRHHQYGVFALDSLQSWFWGRIKSISSTPRFSSRLDKSTLSRKLWNNKYIEIFSPKGFLAFGEKDKLPLPKVKLAVVKALPPHLSTSDSDF